MTKKIVETTEIEESVIFITDEKIKKKFFFFQYEGDLSELEAQLASSKERVNKINKDVKPVEVWS